MASLRDHATQIRTMAKRVVANTNALQRKVALAIDQALVTGTPVLTGRARNNWQIGIGGAPGGVLGPDVPKGKGATARKAALTASGASVTADVLSRNAAAIATGKGEDIHLTNNLPYIVPLNEGHSKLAPAGFIELAIQAGSQAVAGTRIMDGDL